MTRTVKFQIYRYDPDKDAKPYMQDLTVTLQDTDKMLLDALQRIKADVDDADLTIQSWTSIFAGANWHERETWEMFGIVFAGHPDLRKMYLPMDFEGYPLRKDFPLLARIVKPWPGIVDVEPMPGDDDQEEGGAS
jgi:NADH:ubiquinone oxidoreductase subunit C